ncbi:MAG: type II secretion system protein [Candidatus Shapirobacteria bacterium]
MKKAFTLIELLIVMAIMGILTSITAAQFQTAKRKANDVARKGDLNAVSKALQMYFADYGRMPAANAVGQIMVAGVGISWGGEFKDSSGYIYMKQLPVESKLVGSPYCYKVGADGKSYALFAMLENETDSQCDRDKDGDADKTYDCGGNTDAYCFAYISPNISLNEHGTIQ